jgi:hypothetical protein
VKPLPGNNVEISKYTRAVTVKRLHKQNTFPRKLLEQQELCFLFVLIETRSEVSVIGREPPFREDLSTEADE